MNDSASNAISRAPTNPITQTSENLIQSNRHSNISLPPSLPLSLLLPSFLPFDLFLLLLMMLLMLRPTLGAASTSEIAVSTTLIAGLDVPARRCRFSFSLLLSGFDCA